jgi:hypothetical protein
LALVVDIVPYLFETSASEYHRWISESLLFNTDVLSLSSPRPLHSAQLCSSFIGIGDDRQELYRLFFVSQLSLAVGWYLAVYFNLFTSASGWSAIGFLGTSPSFFQKILDQSIVIFFFLLSFEISAVDRSTEIPPLVFR